MPTQTIALRQLHADIDQRVQSIRDDHTDWPCAKGCDRCCHELADVPQLTETEWALLREGLAAQPEERLAVIRADVARLAGDPSRPVTCPLLDRSTGTCPVYRHRPVACRTYGFYVQRDRGLYCRDIDASVADGTLGDVIWGNQDAVDRTQAAFGATHSLVVWFERWARETALSSVVRRDDADPAAADQHIVE